MADDTKDTPDAQAKASPKPDAPKVELPAKIRLVRPYGFVDGEGRTRNWAPGDIVADSAEIAMLIERKAPVEPVKA